MPPANIINLAAILMLVQYLNDFFFSASLPLHRKISFFFSLTGNDPVLICWTPH
jgi:hypothetical protein